MPASAGMTDEGRWLRILTASKLHSRTKPRNYRGYPALSMRALHSPYESAPWLRVAGFAVRRALVGAGDGFRCLRLWRSAPGRRAENDQLGGWRTWQIPLWQWR